MVNLYSLCICFYRNLCLHIYINQHLSNTLHLHENVDTPISISNWICLFTWLKQYSIRCVIISKRKKSNHHTNAHDTCIDTGRWAIWPPCKSKRYESDALVLGIKLTLLLAKWSYISHVTVNPLYFAVLLILCIYGFISKSQK